MYILLHLCILCLSKCQTVNFGCSSQCLYLILQYDAFDIGFITTDDFTNAEILEATYPAVAKRLHADWTNDPAIPIITGFLGKVLLNCCCIRFPAEKLHNLVCLNQVYQHDLQI